MPKSPSPDSGISDSQPKNASDNDSDFEGPTTRSGRRRLSSHSSMEADSPILRRTARKRPRVSSEGMEDDKKSDESSEDESTEIRQTRRNRIVDYSDDEEDEVELTKAKSSKDQLRQVKARRRRRNSSESSPGFRAKEEMMLEEQEDDDDDEDAPAPPRIVTGQRPPKYAKPTRAMLKAKCLEFFNTGLEDEMTRIRGISKRAYAAFLEMRPFHNYEDLMEKLEERKGISSALVRAYLESLNAESELERILADCAQETFELSQAVEYLKREENLSDQVAPKLLTDPDLKLKPYQVLGVRWLHLMYGQKLNAILADEMGLGKTVQIVAFLALLKERRKTNAPNMLHLIVVPSSTIDNWFTELHKWWPEVGVLNYYGGQEDRSFIRQDVLRRVRKSNRANATDRESMEDEDRPLDILLTTYTMITSKPEDRNFLKKISISYAIFDEAHMLKNCKTKRYKELTRIRAQRKILLTGTPLQNNLVELMSLMAFVMPTLFKGEETLSEIFDMFQAREGSKYAGDKILQAKEILRPFILRRLKSQVLTELPAKKEEIFHCEMTKYQKAVYEAKVEFYRNQDKEGEKAKIGAIMQLRKAANHPLLHRHYYDDAKLAEMADVLCREEESLKNSVPNLVVDDLSYMSDFDINKEICSLYKSMEAYRLPTQHLFESGKMGQMDVLLPQLKSEGKKVLLFSQFVIVLDILEDYLKARGISFLRLDGSTPVVERQSLIDDFNHEPEITVFLLSTRAGGLGINLVSATTIILHDIDYNPYNDRQAEDRAHRLGQTSKVRVVKLVAQDSIEERILDLANSKLHLERKVTGDEDRIRDEKEDRQVTMESMLKAALRLA